MILESAFIGLVVGILVGLTGIGGGLLLLPLLISGVGVSPVVAVGSDVVINFFTKIGAGGFHWYRGNVRWPLVLRLAAGSIPGSIIGVNLLARLRQVYGGGLNDVLRIVIGALLVIIPLLYMAGQRPLAGKSAAGGPRKPRQPAGITFIGLGAGFLVGVTSIGAGSVILILLLVFYGFPPVDIVGTDIVHGVLLAGVTGLFQFKLLGNVDLPLVGSVLAGSIPGSFLGVFVSRRFSSAGLRRVLCGVLVVMGARMLWAGLMHRN